MILIANISRRNNVIGVLHMLKISFKIHRNSKSFFKRSLKQIIQFVPVFTL